jgi:hypothetical protein
MNEIANGFGEGAGEVSGRTSPSAPPDATTTGIEATLVNPLDDYISRPPIDLTHQRARWALCAFAMAG